MGTVKPTIREIFFVFLKIGTFAFGGVYSMLSFFEREIVRNKQWLTPDEFAENVAIGQMTPGAPIVNTGISIGYRLGRLKGTIVTAVGLILPSFLLILLMAYFYLEHREVRSVQAALKGVGASVVGLIASVVWRLRKSIIDWRTFILGAACFMGLVVFKLNPITLIIFAGVCGIAMFRGKMRNGTS